MTLLEDREAIRDLIRRYAMLGDQRRRDDSMKLYTDDIEMVITGTLDSATKGKEMMRARSVAGELKRKDPSTGSAPPAEEIAKLDVRHMLSTELIRVSDDGQEGWAWVYYTIVASRGGVADFERGVHDGHYEFTFRKEAGEWLISKQVVTTNNATNPLFQAKPPVKPA